MRDVSFLGAALEGLELQRARIDEQIQQVKQLLGTADGRGGRGRAGTGAAAPRKQRQLSAAARARIAAAQKKRWAEYRKGKSKS
jgi:hypothetical protein